VNFLNEKLNEIKLPQLIENENYKVEITKPPEQAREQSLINIQL